MLPLAPPRPEHLHAIGVDGPVAVIGDVHGDAVRLHRLLRKLEGRTILFAGDLNDRGPDTRGVIDLMLGVGAAGVRGNHEEWLIALAQGRFDTFALHPRMGGAATLLSYGIEARSPSAVEAEAHRIPFAHRDFLWSLPVAIDLTVCGQSYWLTHAGIPPGPRFSEALPRSEIVPWLVRNRPDALLWSNNPPEGALAVDRPVIMGHMCQVEPIDLGHVIAIDTGCGTTDPWSLTALLLPEREFLTV